MTITPHNKPIPAPDPVFDHNLAGIQEHLEIMFKHYGPVLFTTDATGLFDAYLREFPEAQRQHFNCNACRRFIDTYGGLVAIADDGAFTSPFWSIFPESSPYVMPTRALLDKVLAARVTGVFYSKDVQLGTPEAGGWTHFAVKLPVDYSRQHPFILTPGQAMAAKREDFLNVVRALEEFSVADLDQAVAVLKSDALYRGEKLLGSAEWLAQLAAVKAAVKNQKVRDAIMWKAIGTAPAGFCHPRSGMLGTLLEDIQARYPFEQIKQRFDAKMHPLRYQRPQAAPAAGAIAQAEKLVEQLGIAGALRRRFCRLDEIDPLWTPKEAKDAAARPGVFGHLVPKGEQPPPGLEMPARTMTWVKFRDTILPEADAIEFFAPSCPENYTALTTAADADAPPILQWDSPEHRNPVAWYVYHGGRRPEAFGIPPGAYVKVTAVALQPTFWGLKDRPAITHHGESVTFFLEGAHDIENRGGLALFPEFLRSELHGVRSVIEAYSRTGRIEETPGPLACGVRLQKGSACAGRFRVTSRGNTAVYDIDRWD